MGATFSPNSYESVHLCLWHEAMRCNEAWLARIEAKPVAVPAPKKAPLWCQMLRLIGIGNGAIRKVMPAPSRPLRAINAPRDRFLTIAAARRSFARGYR